MPVVGSSAYSTAGQITSLVRTLLNDAQGNLFTDAVLLPYANSAYRKTHLQSEKPVDIQKKVVDIASYKLYYVNYEIS
jgi:hypothetical protein